MFDVGLCRHNTPAIYTHVHIHRVHVQYTDHSSLPRLLNRDNGARYLTGTAILEIELTQDTQQHIHVRVQTLLERVGTLVLISCMLYTFNTCKPVF